MLYWNRCTLETSLSEVMGRHGNASSALYFARESYHSWQMASSHLVSSCKAEPESFLSAHCRWRFVLGETMVIRLRQKEVECREQIAKAFLWVGNWKKALRYAISAIQVAGFDWVDDSKNITTFSGLLQASRLTSCRNSQDLRLRRAVFRVMAKATAADLVRVEFTDSFAIAGPLDIAGGSVGLNWELNSILCQTESKSGGFCFSSACRSYLTYG
jgi:hypothetical protein